MGRQKTVAEKLMEIVDSAFDIVIDATGTAYAVPKSGARIAVPLSGHGGPLTSRLRFAYFTKFGNTPNSNALSGVIEILKARAIDQPRVPVHLRCAQHEGKIVVDLGDQEGRVAVVGPDGWKVRQRGPEGVIFRRTALTSAMPVPKPPGNLDALRALVNVTDESWDLLRAWLVLAWMPDVPVPILSVTGRQGAGKSVLARTIIGLVDPSTAPLRTAPDRAEAWPSLSAHSRVVGIDNISHIKEWFSDALCRAATGEGNAKRMLYTDDDLVVHDYRRAVVLTSIDPGALRGDLAERLLPIELRPLRSRRRSEAALARALSSAGPRILAGVLDLVCEVLADTDEMELPDRMADAARVMAAVDTTLGSSALTTYRAALDSLTDTVLDGDPVAAALLALLRANRGKWDGSPTDLLRALGPYALDARRQWPATPKSLSSRLRRLQPALEGRGVKVSFARGSTRVIKLRWPDAPSPPGARVKHYAG